MDYLKTQIFNNTGNVKRVREVKIIEFKESDIQPWHDGWLVKVKDMISGEIFKVRENQLDYRCFGDNFSVFVRQ